MSRASFWKALMQERRDAAERTRNTVLRGIAELGRGEGMAIAFDDENVCDHEWAVAETVSTTSTTDVLWPHACRKCRTLRYMELGA